MNRPTALAILAFLLCGPACDRPDEIRTYTAPKESATPPPAMSGAPAAAPAPQGDPQATWTVPAGWTRLPDVAQRIAGFSVSPDDPQTIATLTVMGKSYPLIADVNRWEGQLGMPPSGEDALPKLSRQADINGRTVTFVDLQAAAPAEGTKDAARRMLVAIVPNGEERWYVKLTGGTATIAGQVEAFMAFTASLQFGQATPPQAQPQAPVTAEQALASEPMVLEGHAIPEGWVQAPPKPMRELSFLTPADASGSAEVIVSRLSRQFGSLPDNINRWRGQVGLPPLPADQMPQPQVIRIANDAFPAAAYDFTGPAQGEKPGLRMRVVYSVIGPEVWFFKLQGSAAAVESQGPAFDTFLNSLVFKPVEHDHSSPQPAVPPSGQGS
jgi:hypothetical protein